MKKQVAAYILSLGGQPGYSGKTRTLYITDPRKGEPVQSIEECVLNKFGFNLPFRLQTN